MSNGSCRAAASAAAAAVAVLLGDDVGPVRVGGDGERRAREQASIVVVARGAVSERALHEERYT